MEQPQTHSPPGAHRGTWLAVFALVVLGALGYVAWQLQRPAPVTIVPAAVPASQPDADPAPPPRVAPPPRPRPLAASQPGDPGSPAARPLAKLTRAHVRQAQSHLHRAADPCMADALRKNPDLGLRMQIKYTLVVEKGQARASNPQIVKTQIGDKAVEHCIMDQLRAARWPADGPDGVMPVGESFTFKHLRQAHVIE
ncbi:MAG TPA: hypothetical protein VGQ83_33610 [Polyangia bacterium]|jgi:hypothetical protein